ncbi:kelch repeat-containing protein, partial [Thermodesulfobacteriota bacterium]
MRSQSIPILLLVLMFFAVNPTLCRASVYFDSIAMFSPGDWTEEGLWHMVDRGGDCSHEVISGGNSFWYGQDNSCDYDTGATTSGSLISKTITIPASGSTTLTFWSWFDTEDDPVYPQYDRKWVQVEENGSFTNLTPEVGELQDPSTWQKFTYNLDAFSGKDIKIHFTFDSYDATLNNFRGWYLDDIAVRNDSTGEITPNIVDNQHITISDSEPFTVQLDHLDVYDPDSTYPNDFTLTVSDGANYTRTGNTITPHPGFSGILYVSVTVKDGDLSSNPYDMYINVRPTWTPVRQMSTPRYNHSATLLPSGKVLILGGRTYDSGQYFDHDSAILYDPIQGIWTPSASPNIPQRYQHTVNVLPNGRVLLLGGSIEDKDAEIYWPIKDSWESLSSPIPSRVGHSATVLDKGQVLIAGGFRSGEVVDECYLFDPETQEFIETGKMNIPRTGHAAILLPNNKVFVWSGGGAAAEIYDLSTGVWTMVSGSTTGWGTATLLRNGEVLLVGHENGVPTAVRYDVENDKWMTAAVPDLTRGGHTASLLQNGKVLIIGGWMGGETVPGAELYDPDTDTWHYLGDLDPLREGHTVTVLPDGRVLLAGGKSQTDTDIVIPFGILRYHSSVEIFDPLSYSSSPTRHADNKYSEGCSALLPSGKVLLTAQENGELFDPVTETWQSTGWRMTNNSMSCVVLADGNVLLGGETYNPGTDTWSATTTDPKVYEGTPVLLNDGRVLSLTLNETQIYDPISGIWDYTTFPPPQVTRTQKMGTITKLLDGRVMVAGGVSGSGTTPVAEIFDPATNHWTRTGDMTTARTSHSAILLPNGKVLLSGGIVGENHLSSSELFDPVTGIWSPMGDMNQNHSNHTSTLLPSGKVLICGGGATTDYCEMYDPATSKWQMTTSMFEGRSNHSATLLSDHRILITGGPSPYATVSMEAELYTESGGYDPSWRPVISTVTDPFVNGNSLQISGSGFTGNHETSGGNGSQNSPANYPIVQLRTLNRDYVSYVLPDSTETKPTFNDTKFISLPLSGLNSLPDGYLMVTVIVGGIPSESTIIQVNTAPTVLSVTRESGAPDSTNATSINFEVTFSEAVTDVDADDFFVDHVLNISGGIVTNVTGSGNVYIVTVEEYSGTGWVGLDVVNNSTIVDIFNEPLARSFTTGENYWISTESPFLTSLAPMDPTPTNSSSVQFMAIFSGDVTGVDVTDFSFPGTNTVTDSGITITDISGEGQVFIITVSGYSGEGILGLNLVDNDSIQNDLTTPLGGAGAGNGNFTGTAYTIDIVPPQITAIQRDDPSPTSATSIDYLVIFDEPVYGVGTNDFTLRTDTLIGGTIAGVTSSGNIINGSDGFPYTDQYLVTVNNYSGAGQLWLDFVDDDSIRDQVGNLLGGINPPPSDYAAGESYNVDVRQQTAINCNLNTTTMTLGELPVITGQLTLNGGGQLPVEFSGSVNIKLTPPSGEAHAVTRSVSTYASGPDVGLYTYTTVCDDIDEAGVWTITASYPGSVGAYTNASDQSPALTVAEATTELTLAVPNSVKFGNPVTISGQLTVTPDCGRDMSGTPILLEITEPDLDPDDNVPPRYVEIAVPAEDVLSTGYFTHTLTVADNVFDMLGKWQVKARFYQDNAYLGAVSSTSLINVIEAAGYAIIIQGRISSNEGALAHQKTTDFVFKTLRGKGLQSEDIFYFSYADNTDGDFGYDENSPAENPGIIDALPDKTDIMEALTIWAREQMDPNYNDPQLRYGSITGKPGDLTLVFVDHGSTSNDDGVFHIYDSNSVPDSSITSTELNTWLTDLQTNLTGGP